jgi:predicted O-methyltransferase YrrM
MSEGVPYSICTGGTETLPDDFESFGHNTPVQDRLYLASLMRELDAKQVIEVGCYTGMTTRSLVDAKPDVVVHAIDHFVGNRAIDKLTKVGIGYRDHGKEGVQEVFSRNLSDVLFRRVFMHAGTSAFYASIWPFKVDLIFIDASHEYEDVKKDIGQWSPHVRPGGILCGHDFSVYGGVTRAAMESDIDEVVNYVWVKRM